MKKFIVLGLLTILFAACGGGSSSTARDPEPQSSYQVEYRVTGRGGLRKASLTLQNETGNTEQIDVSVPWSLEMTLERGDFAYLSAQNETVAGEITCEILVNGVVVETATSNADYGIASCSGSIGE